VTGESLAMFVLMLLLIGFMVFVFYDLERRVKALEDVLERKVEETEKILRAFKNAALVAAANRLEVEGGTGRQVQAVLAGVEAEPDEAKK
jgi:uncharacterized membrane protein YqgA involved in biofilm formation